MIRKDRGHRAIGTGAPHRRIAWPACTGLVLGVLLHAICLVQPALLVANQAVGRWKGPYSLENTPWAKPQAMHLALLRGQADTSIVLYWRDPTEAWVVPIPDGTYATEPDYFINRAKVPSLWNTDIHCSGHNSIDGKLLVRNRQ